jgi:hypothetical protein
MSKDDFLSEGFASTPYYCYFLVAKQDDNHWVFQKLKIKIM